VLDGVLVDVLVGVDVNVAVGVLVGVLVNVFVDVLVDVFVGVLDGVLVNVAVGVLVGVLDGVAVSVWVAVFVGVLVAVAVRVIVGVLVAVLVGVEVAATAGASKLLTKTSKSDAPTPTCRLDHVAYTLFALDIASQGEGAFVHALGSTVPFVDPKPSHVVPLKRCTYVFPTVPADSPHATYRKLSLGLIMGTAPVPSPPALKTPDPTFTHEVPLNVLTPI
jgi:hypothetical protein